MTTTLILSAILLAAEPQTEDSLVFNLQAIEVIASKPSDTDGVSGTMLTGKELARGSSYGRDIPSILLHSPSVVSYSETGCGIGGGSMRIRGTDATRIAVTVNGMPLNEPDSHAMYWYDTPDLAGSAGSIQVIRGAGSTKGGADAFGGAVSLSTAPLDNAARAGAALSYGSFGSSRLSVRAGSGLIGGKWIADLRLSSIKSDGYVDRGSTSMGSYMAQVARMGPRSLLKFVSFGGKTKTYLTYEGVSREDLEAYGPTYHTSGQYKSADGPFVLRDGTRVDYFADQTDNYLQINNQLIYDHFFGDRWSLGAMLFGTLGDGYYRQYKDDAYLCSYDNLSPDADARADLIRRKNMVSDKLGIQANAAYAGRRLNLSFGAGWMTYSSRHHGTIDWIDGVEKSAYDSFCWYSNDTGKREMSARLNAEYALPGGFTAHARLAVRHVAYRAGGTNDNYDWSASAMQPIAIDREWTFWAPGACLSWTDGSHVKAWASWAVASKEPTRADFTDRYKFSSLAGEPQPETMHDFELCCRLTYPRFEAEANLYHMQYRNQLIPTGIVNDSEDNLNVNVDDSFRRGIELSLTAKAARWLDLGGNCTLSQNKIRDFDEVVADEVFHHDLVDIAYSPAVVASGFASIHHGCFEFRPAIKYVSKQYVSNGGHDDLSLPGYCVADADLSYSFAVRRATLRLAVKVSNLTDALYFAYGYGGSYMSEGTRQSYLYLFPQAPRSATGSISISF